MIRVLLFILMILIPGYLFTTLLFNKKEINKLEKATLTIVLGIALIIGLGVVLGFNINYFGGLTFTNLIISWIVVTSVLLALVIIKNKLKKSKTKTKKKK